MVRAARRYDLYLPLTFNDGRPIPDQLFALVEKTLLERFAGITSQQREFPLRGIWQGKKHLFFDQVIVVTALDFRRRGSRVFWAKLKKALLAGFAQLEILITESSLRVH
jgi:hypothetical protein